MMNIKSNKTSDNTPLAVVVIVVTVFALAFGDALIKKISSGLTLWQIFTIRSLVVLPVLLAVVHRRSGRGVIRPIRPGWTVLRSLMLTFMWVAYYMALPHIDLSVAAASYYTLPIFIALFSSYFLKDSVGRSGWAAVVMGFIGVALILQPDTDRFNGFALLPILSAVLYALSMILTRSHCRRENVFVLSLWLNLSMLLVGLLGSLAMIVIGSPGEAGQARSFVGGVWTTMAWDDWMAIGLLAAVIVIASVGAAAAYQIGHSPTVATFDFAYVAFAAVWGFILFHEVPDVRSILGMILIITAGILAVRNPSKSGTAPPGKR